MSKLADAAIALADKIAAARDRVRKIVETINEMSHTDVRGKTPDISKQIRSLDEERVALVIERRTLQQDLAVLHSIANKKNSESVVASIGRLSAVLSEESTNE